MKVVVVSPVDADKNALSAALRTLDASCEVFTADSQNAARKLLVEHADVTVIVINGATPEEPLTNASTFQLRALPLIEWIREWRSNTRIIALAGFPAQIKEMLAAGCTESGDGDDMNQLAKLILNP